MKIILATALAASLALGAGVATAGEDMRPGADYPNCVLEDGSSPDGNGTVDCVWDARHQGNGIGRSFIHTRTGRVIYIPHRFAHALTH